LAPDRINSEEIPIFMIAALHFIRSFRSQDTRSFSEERNMRPRNLIDDKSVMLNYVSERAQETDANGRIQ
jgi:hypothetical protein